jgi:hypothetical protein
VIDITCLGVRWRQYPSEVAPSVLDVIQFGSAVRQPFDGEPWPGVESGLRGLAEMYGPLARTCATGLVGYLDLRVRRRVSTAMKSLLRLVRFFSTMGLPLSEVGRTNHGELAGLAGRFDAQIGAALGQDVREIAMGERPRLRLLRQQAEAGGVISCCCSKTRPKRRGKAQFGRTKTLSSQPNVQCRCWTLSGLTQKASAIRELDQPSNESGIARARSASSRVQRPGKGTHLRALLHTRYNPRSTRYDSPRIKRSSCRGPPCGS